jgi:Glycine/D-amino acid oxidases (deaminating)
MTRDVVVAGGGLIGYCVATALAERGLTVAILSESSIGEASNAAAGMLAPSVERAGGAAHDFAVAARDRYPEYLERLAGETGIDVPLNREGILQVALTPAGVKGLKKSLPPKSSWLEQDELVALEPALAHALGAVHNPLDGAVDNVLLFSAVQAWAVKLRGISRTAARVTQVAERDDSVLVTTSDRGTVSAKWVVIAAGAWSGEIEGARYGIAVSPLKGQLIRYSGVRLRHAMYGPRGYLVPRRDSIIAGSTMEQTGFDSSTSPAGIAKIRAAAEEILPALKRRDPSDSWAGLRPVTPDLLPLLGPDPDAPHILYASGHSRNGVLMAPLTGDIIADLVTGSPLRHDLKQFRPNRF